MHAFLHAHPWLFYLLSGLIIFTARWHGAFCERRKRARREREEVNIPMRYQPFAVPRQVDTPTWLYTDRQLH